MSLSANRPLRILFVLRTPVGGLFRNVMDVARGLSARGHQLGILCDSTTGGPRADQLLNDLKPSLALGLHRVPMRRNPHYSDIQVLRETERLVRTLKPDVVQGEGAKGGFFARFAGIFRPNSGPIRSYTPHGGSLHYPPGTPGHHIFMTIERLLEKGSDLLLFESAYAQTRYRELVCATKRPSAVALNGLYPHEYEPCTPRPEATDFFYIGEFRQLKGIDTLIEALVLLASTGRRPTLTLIGSGPDEDEIRALVQARGLSEQVSWRGITPAREAFTLGRVMVLPSRFESLPYVILEAVAGHVPLISTNVGGIGEVLPPDTLIPPNAPQRLAEEMIRMLDRPYAEIKAEAAERSAETRKTFTVERMIETIENAYYSTLTARRPGTL